MKQSLWKLLLYGVDRPIKPIGIKMSNYLSKYLLIKLIYQTIINSHIKFDQICIKNVISSKANTKSLQSNTLLPVKTYFSLQIQNHMSQKLTNRFKGFIKMKYTILQGREKNLFQNYSLGLEKNKNVGVKHHLKWGYKLLDSFGQ